MYVCYNEAILLNTTERLYGIGLMRHVIFPISILFGKQLA